MLPKNCKENDHVQETTQGPRRSLGEAAVMPPVLPLQLSRQGDTCRVRGELHQHAKIVGDDRVRPQFHVVAARGPLQELPSPLLGQDR